MDIKTTTLRLLLLEDEPNDAELNIATLEEAGYNCQWERVDTREDFLACLESPNYDLILSDYKLPSFDGLMALALVLEHNIDIPVIMVSGTLGEDAAIDSIKAGATDYVLKNRLSRLVPVVKRALREHEELRERKQTKQALQESEERFRKFTEMLPVGVFVTDADDKTTYWNKRLREITGMSDEEGMGAGWTDGVHPDDRERVFKEWYKSKEARSTFNLEYRFVDRKGKITNTIGQAILMTDFGGNIIGYLGTITDITEQKQAEQALRESEEEFKSLAENSQDYIMRYDKQGRHLYQNAAAYKVSGFSEQEFIGKTHRELGFEGKLCDLWEEKIAQVFKTKKPCGTLFEWESIEDTIFLDWRLYPEFDQHENVKTVLGISRDITEQKQAEKELADLNAHLEEQVNERTMQLAKTTEKAEVANRAKSEFLANMSHEIRTPMNAILGFTEILSSKVQEPQHQEYLAAINSSGKTLLNLLNDILDLAKVEAGKLELEYTAVEPAKVFHDIGQLFTSKIIENQLEFKIDIAPNMPSALFLDETRLRQILLNLLSNAVKFTNSGFVKLSSSWIETTGEFIFTIEDSGKGISTKHQETVFAAFTQQNGQEHAKYGGTGLGLTITRRLVEMMGGTISLNSVLNQGSTFKIRFPQVEIATPIANESVANFDLEKFQFEPAKILIVEDIKLNRDLIKAYLIPYKTLDLLETDNGKDAIILTEQYCPNLILMDKKMPVMNGYEAAKRIKSHPRLSHIPIIFITASLMKKEKDVLKVLCDGFLGKPINRGDLIMEISRFLAHSKVECAKITEPTEIEAMALTPEMLARLSALLDILQNELDAQWQNISQTPSLSINGLIVFGKRVQTLGNEYGYPLLQNWGNILQNQAKLFDVNALLITLRSYPDLVDNLTELLNHEK